MARLILLNGVPATGKSTLARRFAAAHPPTLNLDIDQVAQLIGGWQSNPAETMPLARSNALTMAATHLMLGHDVLVPQYVGRVSELERFERVAADTGAGFRHVILDIDQEGAVHRFMLRSAEDDSPWTRLVTKRIDQAGGPVELRAMWSRLQEVARARPDAIRVRSHDADVDGTYTELLAVLHTAC